MIIIDSLIWLFKAWLLLFVLALCAMMLHKVYQDCCAAANSIFNALFRRNP